MISVQDIQSEAGYELHHILELTHEPWQEHQPIL